MIQDSKGGRLVSRIIFFLQMGERRERDRERERAQPSLGLVCCGSLTAAEHCRHSCWFFSGRPCRRTGGVTGAGSAACLALGTCARPLEQLL